MMSNLTHYSLVLLLATFAWANLNSAANLSATQERTIARDLQRDYHTINTYLEEHCGDSHDTELILNTAGKWLDSLNGGEQRDSSESLISSLELFLSLQLLGDPKQACNARGHSIMELNNQALANLARYAMRPVDRVALEYMQKHAGECCSRYPSEFEQRIASLDQDKRRQVETFGKMIGEFALARGYFEMSFGETHLESLLKHNPLSYILLLDEKNRHKLSEVRRRDEASALGEILVRLTGEAVLPNDREELSRVFHEQLVEPCEHYAQRIGSDVFEPLESDLRVILDSRGSINDCDPKSIEFKLGFVNQKLCRMFVLGEDPEQTIELLLH